MSLFVIAWTIAHQAPLPMNFPGTNTEMGWHFLLQSIFPTQGLNPAVLHCRQILYHMSYQGSPCLFIFKCPMYLTKKTQVFMDRRVCVGVGVGVGVGVCVTVSFCACVAYMDIYV